MNLKLILVRSSCLVLILFLSIRHVSGQIWSEDFSSGTNYNVTRGAEGSDGSSDYFMRTDGSDIGITYTGTSGFFFAAQDIDDSGWAGSASPSQLTWSSIDITSYSSLKFSGAFASDANAKIDNDDYVLIEYRVDGGTWSSLMAFENDGTTYNTQLGEDTDFDGNSDGADLSSTFVSFSSIFSVTGSVLDIRITVALNSGGEDVAFDDFSLEENVLSSEPTNHVSGFTATASAYNQVDLTWSDNDGTQSAEGFLVKASTTDYASINAPADGAPVSDDTNLTDGSGAVNVAHGVENYSWTGLSEQTTYYFKIFPYTNTGAEIDYKTDGTVPENNATTTAAPVTPDLIISEVSDPGDDYNGRFVELFNAGNNVIDFSQIIVFLSRQSNGGNHSSIQLTGKIRPGEAYTIANNSAFESIYAISADADFGSITGNGDDGYFLYVGGDETTGLLFDAYGELDKDGSGLAWEYENSRAVRNISVTAPNSTWTASEWTITTAALADMTPAAHNHYTTFSGATDNTWGTAGNWTGGVVPSPAMNVNIPAGGKVTISNPAICNNLILESGNTATASLIGAGNLTIAGTATVEQYLAETSQFYNWHYLSVPVSFANANLFPGVTHNSQKIFASQWNESSHSWENITAADELNTLKGYAVPVNENTKVEFSGALITGDQSASGLSYHAGNTYSGFHLIGNPFTAALDASLLNGSNWTTDIWIRADGDFKEYNVSGGTGTLTDGLIPAMQGFWVKTTANGGSVDMATSALTHGSTPLYKSKPTNRLRFEVSRDAFTDDMIIYCNVQAQNGYDLFDTEKRFAENSNYPQLYTSTGGNKLAIHGMEPLANEERRVSLGLKSDVPGEIKINVSGLETFDASANVYLQDNQSNKLIDLREMQSYTFSISEAVNTDDRFTVIFSTNDITAVNELTNRELKMWTHANQLYIKSTLGGSSAIQLMDVYGRQIFIKQMELTNGVINLPLNQQKGVYFVRVTVKNKVFTQKIILR